MATTNGLTKRIERLEATGATGTDCRTCAARPAFTLDGRAEACRECGREPLVFTIDIDRAGGMEGDAA